MAAAARRSPVSSVSVDPDPAASDPSEVAATRLDGRRTHIIDRALDYAQLAEQGLSAARIARKRRRSEGYVSIALRLGRAIRGMEPGELSALRSPRITWKLAQRIVREDADALAVRHQLRAALGGFSTHNVDGRKHRKGRRAGRAAERPAGAAWGWDPAWFARDPLGFVDAHLRYLSGLQRVVQERAGRTVGARSAERVPVGQSIRSLQRSLHRTLQSSAGAPSGRAEGDAAGPVVPTAETQALAVLQIVARKLAEARTEVAGLVDVPTTSAASDRPGPPDPAAAASVARPRRAEPVRRPDWDEALAADLDD
jgi:hypothetical protein